MTLKPYKDLLAMGKEKLQEMMALPRAMEMKSKAQHEISKLDVKMAEMEGKISDIAATYPVDFDKLIAAQDELALATRRRGQLVEIVGQMFPDQAAQS